MNSDEALTGAGLLPRRDSLGRLIEPSGVYVSSSPPNAYACSSGAPARSSPRGIGGMEVLIDALDAAWMGHSGGTPDMLRLIGSSVMAAPRHGAGGGGGMHGSAVCVTATGMAITHGHATSPPHPGMHLASPKLAPSSMEASGSGGAMPRMGVTPHMRQVCYMRACAWKGPCGAPSMGTWHVGGVCMGLITHTHTCQSCDMHACVWRGLCRTQVCA